MRNILPWVVMTIAANPAFSAAPIRVQIDAGTLEIPATAGVRAFEGIPFAESPVNDLRWKPPVPVKAWTGVRKADAFGSRCMQGSEYSDMIFRDPGISEDCLTLNVWTPAKAPGQKLAVLVWVYGGGFTAGAGSEPRYDGSHLAQKGIVVVSMNYRLGVFGFMAHEELTAESPHHASGNYGLLDQALAIDWVKRNIAAFGGDPAAITIAGESAGSFSVSALMASPVSKDLIHGAIGESGAFFSSETGTLGLRSLSDMEQTGKEFAGAIGAGSLAALRAMPAAQILKAALPKLQSQFVPAIDGYFLPESVDAIYREGKQAHIPLLAGWNKDEAKAFVLFAKDKPTALSFMAQATKMFGEHTDAFLKLYPGETDVQAAASAGELADAQFIGYSTWAWMQAHLKTGAAPVYRYMFDLARPVAENEPNPGTVHSSEIEYVFGTIDSWKLRPRPEDRKLSEAASTYWANFVKSGDPNGGNMTKWPSYNSDNGFKVMHLDEDNQVSPEQDRDRYQFLDNYAPFSVNH